MNTLQKIGLGIGAVALGALATRPFFMRSSPPQQDELVDVLCRDVWESSRVMEWLNDPSRKLNMRNYQLHSGEVTVLAYNSITWDLRNELFKTKIVPEGETEGRDIEDATPQIIDGSRVVGCRIIDNESNTRKEFSPEEMHELEGIARTNNTYRELEREIFEDVDLTGETLSEKRIFISTIAERLSRNLIPREYSDKYNSVLIPISKGKTYELGNGIVINIKLDCERKETSEYLLIKEIDGKKIVFDTFLGINHQSYHPEAENNSFEELWNINKENVSRIAPNGTVTNGMFSIPKSLLEKIIEAKRRQ